MFRESLEILHLHIFVNSEDNFVNPEHFGNSTFGFMLYHIDEQIFAGEIYVSED